MKLDRDFQRELLFKFSDCYPDFYILDDQTKWALEYRKKYIATAIYLEEHGLIESNIRRTMGGEYSIGHPKLTAKGNDFIEDDGGLSAILGVVTVRIHDGTIKELIEMKIMQSDLSYSDKQKLTSQLRSLPAETIKHLVMKLVDMGLESAPSAISLISKYLGL